MNAKLNIYGKSLEITDRINGYVNSKIDKIDRFLNDIDDVRVDLSKMNYAANRYTSQITIRGKGYMLRSEESADDLAAAFDASLDKIIRQIDRFKGKRNRGRGDGSTVGGELSEPIPYDILDEEEKTSLIARRKKFAVLPMDEDEAIEQMKLSAHEDFFIFFNAQTDSLNVLYKRHDGTYGLIEPEIS